MELQNKTSKEEIEKQSNWKTSYYLFITSLICFAAFIVFMGLTLGQGGVFGGFGGIPFFIASIITGAMSIAYFFRYRVKKENTIHRKISGLTASGIIIIVIVFFWRTFVFIGENSLAVALQMSLKGWLIFGTGVGLIIFGVFQKRKKTTLQEVNDLKIKSTKKIITSIAIILLLFLTVIGILAYRVLYYVSGSEARDKFSKYDQKIYSVTSEDGFVQGFISTRIASTGEFPASLALNAYFNLLIKKEPFPLNEGRVNLNSIGNIGNLVPILCDVDITKIYPYDYYSPAITTWPFDCNNSSDNQSIKSFFVSSYKSFEVGGSLNKLKFPNIDTIDIYDKSGSNLLKTYKISIQQTNN